jgi:hypothetical protein
MVELDSPPREVSEIAIPDSVEGVTISDMKRRKKDRTTFTL